MGFHLNKNKKELYSLFMTELVTSVMSSLSHTPILSSTSFHYPLSCFLSMSASLIFLQKSSLLVMVSLTNLIKQQILSPYFSPVLYFSLYSSCHYCTYTSILCVHPQFHTKTFSVVLQYSQHLEEVLKYFLPE